VKGVRHVFTPEYRHVDGMPGYPELPKGLNKMQRDSFYEFDAGGDAPVEQATAEPGAKRSVAKPRSKKTAAKK
jgi:hypothetical protein